MTSEDILSLIKNDCVTQNYDLSSFDFRFALSYVMSMATIVLWDLILMAPIYRQNSPTQRDNHGFSILPEYSSKRIWFLSEEQSRKLFKHNKAKFGDNASDEDLIDMLDSL